MDKRIVPAILQKAQRAALLSLLALLAIGASKAGAADGLSRIGHWQPSAASPLGADGDPCSNGSQCTSGHCADGVCCDTSCECGQCNIGISLGFCVIGEFDPAGSPGNPSCAPYLCNGSSTACPDTCSSSSDCVSGDVCNGQGQCVPGAGVPLLSMRGTALLVLVLSTLGAVTVRRWRRE